MNDFDVLIVGAGPVGLTFAATLAKSNLKVALVEQLPRYALEKPGFDGREIALTHDSVRTLRACGVWERIPATEISPLRAARVLNGDSRYSMQIAKPGLHAEALGFLVANQLLRQASWECARSAPRLTVFNDSRVGSLEPSEDGAAMCVTLHDHTMLRASLAVSADSRFSETRHAAGISATTKDFGRTMLVCRMWHSKAHHSVAWEWFAYGQTLAALPLNGGFCSSLVITVDERQARRLQQMSETDFSADVERRFEGRLGAMQLCSERHAYPLIGVLADRFVSRRYALIGDAAVGMHPVTAHGFNLGLRGQATLAREIIGAASRGGDIGAADLLLRYEREHRRAALPIYVATNALVKLYTAETPPLRVARHALLRLADRFTPFRHAVAAMI